MRGPTQQLTTQQVASYCGVTSQTVDDWLTNGRLAALSKNGQKMVDASDLMQFMDDNHLAIPQDLSHPEAIVVTEEEVVETPPSVSGAKSGGSLQAHREGPCAMMIVADDYIAITAEHILKDLGIQVVKIALEDVTPAICRTLSPELLMLDLARTDSRSLELIETAKAATDGTGSVLVISDQMPTALVRAKAAGANAILTKPFDNDTFKRTVKILLNLG